MTVDLVTSAALLRSAAARTAGVLRGAADGPVPGLEWSVAETAAHVIGEFTDYAAYAQGKKDPGPPLDRNGGETPSWRNAAANAAQLRRFADRDLARLADRLEPAVEEFLTVDLGPEPVPVPNGLTMSRETMTSALLGELVVHGFDIARATGARWRIERPEALQVIAGVMTMLPEYLDRRRAAGVHTVFELRLRGGPRYLVTVDGGAATVTGRTATGGGSGPRPDCWIAADPAAFVLVGFGRVGQWGRIARGDLVAGGRKPWLAASFGKLITGP
jgi:uncharacterized protein (TIGR03083 family)